MQIPLFNQKTVKRLCSRVKLTHKQKIAAISWLHLLEQGILKKEKESYFKFAKYILEELLGYDLKKLDFEAGNIEFSFKNKEDKLVLGIEAKGTKTKDLFAEQKGYREGQNTPINQLWTYMGKLNLNYGIATNYKNFVLIDRSKGSSTYHFFDFLEIKNNEEKLKEFVAIFSKGQIIDNQFIEKLEEASAVEEKNFTKEFYKLFHETRLMLVKEFQENGASKEESIHYAQLYLNRLMFVFFAEDTDKLDKRLFEDSIITALKVEGLVNDQSKLISDSILSLFRRLDKGSLTPRKIFGFNGGLFKEEIPAKIYFKDFKERRFFLSIYQHSNLKKEIELDAVSKPIFERYGDKLNPIIKNLLVMASFDFNTEVNVNILGHIFEQSLSDLEELKEGKITKRKKEGIFYTPEYITDYICRNTIIPYLSEKDAKTSRELVLEYKDDIKKLEEKFAEIKILDPACGSGAFLIKAIDVLLEIHKEIQIFKQDKGDYTAIKKGRKKKKDKGQLMLIKWNEEDEAREIIENNIFGVDLNEESVEITKLSLFLKITKKNKKLIDLSKNIKVGNSLIDDKSVDSKAFRWKEEFKDIFDKGGFDVVVGNPPYGAKLTEEEVKFVKKNYSVGNSETAQLMMEKAHSLLKDKGCHGFIIPKAFTFVSTWDKIRNKFLYELKIIIDCKKVWKEVKLEQIIYIIQKGNKFSKYDSGIRDNQLIKIIANVNKLLISKFDGVLLNSLTNKEIKIGSKIKEINTCLKDFGKDGRGDLFYQQMNQNKKGFKVLGGKGIQRYFKKGIKGYIEEKYVKTPSLIKPNSVLLQRIIAHIENPKDHLRIAGTIFEDSNYKIVDTVYQITLDKDTSNKYILAILNSNFMNWFVYRFIFAKAIRSFQFSGDVAKKIPIPKLSPSKQKPFIENAELILKLRKELYEKKEKFLKLIKHEYKIEKITKKLDKFCELEFDDFMKQLKVNLNMDKKAELLDFFEKNKKEILELKNKIDKIDKEIDEMVYKLYGLTKKEIKIIEESLK